MIMSSTDAACFDFYMQSVNHTTHTLTMNSLSPSPPHLFSFSYPTNLANRTYMTTLANLYTYANCRHVIETERQESDIDAEAAIGADR